MKQSETFLSVIIPIYNEEANLSALFDRIYPVLDDLKVSFEIVFVNDGSRDRSLSLLKAMYEARPKETRIIHFQSNFGQHMAIMAGFEHSRGQLVVTLDADLQNPPEEIPNLLAEYHKGHDYIGTIRRKRHDNWWRSVVSKAANWIRKKITDIELADHGCMLRGYDRRIINAINACQEPNIYIPALAYSFAMNPIEIEVEHSSRMAGESKYSLYKLIRLNFDLVTGFSVVPLQLCSLFGLLVAVGSAAFFIFLVVRRLIVGPEAEGLFTLFSIAFFLIGMILFSLGLLGEYVGRIYQVVRKRPRYIIESIVEENGEKFISGQSSRFC